MGFRYKEKLFILGAIFCFFHIPSIYGDLPTQPVLPTTVAAKMVNAIIAKAKPLDLKVTVAIVDNAGLLKCFYGMDDAPTSTIEIAQRKARTAARVRVSTREVAELNLKYKSSPFSSLSFITTFAGGFPITTKSGEFIGGIGVSGATPEEDEVCAQAGLKALTSYLDNSSAHKPGNK